MKNYIQNGDSMVFTAGADISAGDMVLVSGIVGVAVNDVLTGAEGVMQVTGVFEVPKEAEAIAQGAAVYYKASTGKVTTTASGNKQVGWAWTAGAEADATIHVRLIL